AFPCGRSAACTNAACCRHRPGSACTASSAPTTCPPSSRPYAQPATCPERSRPMPRKSHPQILEADPATAEAPFVLHPNAILFPDQFKRLFRLKESTLRREVREGRLVVYKRGGRYYLIGSEIMEWLRGGEVKVAGRSA